ncbi:MAG: 6-phosphogluconolactonase [Acidimicrobiia bacterium]|nr:6-phosphogluconolactonase [Acidimicrobiia bacterium]
MTTTVSYEVVDDVAAAFAAHVADTSPASIAFSGGDTARDAYTALAATSGIDWSGIDVYWGDERFVPIDDPDSNEGMTRGVLLDGVSPRAVHSMRGDADTPGEAAAAYDSLIRATGGIEFVHLGLGPDGHTCSLFPGSAALSVTDRWVTTNADDEHPHPRLTFTYPAVAASAQVVFTAAGESKRAAFDGVRRHDPSLPASRIRADRILWIVDPAAAGSWEQGAEILHD